MRNEQYRNVVREGLAPLVEDVPPGPEWDDLTVPRRARVSADRGRSVGLLGLAVASFALLVGAPVLIWFGVTTSTPTTAPTATAFAAPGSSISEDQEVPILRQATGSFVYLTTDNRLTEVDIDSATATVHNIPELAPGDPPFRLIRRGDEFVFFGETGGRPAVFALEPETPTSPTLIDEAWFFIPGATEDKIWLAILDESSPGTERALESVREVSVDGSVATGDVPPPNARWPVAAVEKGLVFQGDEALEVWDPNTQMFVDTLPGEFPVAAWHNRIVTCGECENVNLIDLEEDTRRVIEVPEGVAMIDGYGGAFSPDGRYVAVPGFETAAPIRQETDVSVVLIDFEKGTASVVPGMSHEQSGYPQVAWSSDGAWLFFSVGELYNETGSLFAFRPGDDTAYRIPVVLDGQYYGMTAR